MSEKSVEDIYIRKTLANHISSSYRVRAVLDPGMVAAAGFDMYTYTKKSLASNLAMAIIDSNNYPVREIKNHPEYIGITYEAQLWNFNQEDLIALIKQAFNDGVEVGKMEKVL